MTIICVNFLLVPLRGIAQQMAARLGFGEQFNAVFGQDGGGRGGGGRGRGEGRGRKGGGRGGYGPPAAHASQPHAAQKAPAVDLVPKWWGDGGEGGGRRGGGRGGGGRGGGGGARGGGGGARAPAAGYTSTARGGGR